MDKKVLVLDLDGTLTNSEKKITPETKKALMEIQEQGHTVVLASGRPTAGIEPLAEELKLKENGGYILSFNGGKITDCSTDEVIYQKTLPPELVPDLFRLARKLDIGLLSYDEDNNIITGMHYDEYIDVEKNINHLPVKQMERVEDYVDFPLNKCLGTAEPSVAAEAEKIYEEKFGDKLCISRSEPFFLEITPKGIDKAASLERFCQMTGHKREDMIACGDGFNDLSMIKYAGLGVGVILMALLTYVISVFVIHQIQRESSVIGALYALGAKKKDLIRHYVTLPTIVAFVGGIIGAVIGFSPVGIDYQLLDSYAYFSLPDFTPVYPLYLIIYSIVMPPVVSVIVNTLVINKRLSQTALSLIRNEQKTGHYSRVKIKSRNFIRRFQMRQMLREMRTGITVLLSMLFSLFILMLGVDCYYLCENVRKDTINDTKYEYMYTLKYPEESVPEGGEACFVKTLSKEQLGYNLDVTVMGMDSDNKYYDVKTHKGKSFITVSQSVVERYGVAKGDKFILTDDATSMDYAFTVEDICDERGGLMVFMDIDSMRELFGESDTYYNCLLSDKKLDIDEGRLYSTTTKSDIERSAAVFTDLMMSMIVMLIAVAVIIFCSVMFLMLNVTIERASFGISLVKVFGYKTKDVKKLYLNGNAIIITLGALIEIPLSKMFMDKVFPVFIPNVTSGINLAFPWYAYVIIFAGVMATYFIITSILVRKLGKITPAEVLKNRE